MKQSQIRQCSPPRPLPPPGDSLESTEVRRNGSVAVAGRNPLSLLLCTAMPVIYKSSIKLNKYDTALIEWDLPRPTGTVWPLACLLSIMLSLLPLCSACLTSMKTLAVGRYICLNLHVGNAAAWWWLTGGICLNLHVCCSNSALFSYDYKM